MPTLRLREWRLDPALPLDPVQVDLLLTRFAAQVTPTPGQPERYDVRPGSRVGVARSGEWQVVVEPKLPVPRVLFLVAYGSDPRSWQEDADLDEASDLPEALAELFARRTERALARGLLRGYRDVEDALMTVRGRVDLAEQVRRRPGLAVPVQVRYQEFDEDVLENRLLLAATGALRRLPLRAVATRRALHRLQERFELVSEVHVPAQAVPEVTWNRLNEHYRSAVELARRLLAGRSMELRDGSATGAELVLDMNEVFETLVRIALREALGLSKEEFPVAAAGRGLVLDEAERVALEPDLSWWRGRRCVWVGDVKYKRDSGKGANGDLYQLLAYATAAGLRSGRLVYADGSAAARHTVVHAGVQLVVDRLDVSLPPQELLAAVARLADRVRATAAA